VQNVNIVKMSWDE